jgi:hypothetical protein
VTCNSFYFINFIIISFREYLAAVNTRCPYPNNTFACGGKAKIKRYLVYNTNQWSEFIGCDKWKQNEKGHMSLQIKAGVDINLLKSLFANEGRIANQEVCIQFIAFYTSFYINIKFT